MLFFRLFFHKKQIIVDLCFSVLNNNFTRRGVFGGVVDGLVVCRWALSL